MNRCQRCRDVYESYFCSDCCEDSAREDERSDVVAWLLEEASLLVNVKEKHIKALAKAIEDCEHLQRY